MSHKIDDPNMSDTTILMTVEHLIQRALGPTNMNVVDFKMIQTILHILARQQRVLQQRVELRTSESSPKRKTRRSQWSKKGKDESDEVEDGALKGKVDREKRGRKGIDVDEDAAFGKDKKDSRDKKEKKGKDGKAEEELKSTEKDDDDIDEDTGRKKEKDRKRKRSTKKGRDISPTMRDGSPASYEISESGRGRDKVLVVEKGRRARTESRPRTSSIDVVTQSQFALLEAAVEELKDVVSPPSLTLPDNKKLRSDLASGNASLPEAMQAMKVNARVKAAEGAITRMADLLTQLAASGAMPKDLAAKVKEVKLRSPGQAEDLVSEDHAHRRSITFSGAPPTTTLRKSVTIEAKSPDAHGPSTAGASTLTPRRLSGAALSRSTHSIISLMPGVTQEDLNVSLKKLKDELMKYLNDMTTKASTAAESALLTAQAVSDKLSTAVNLNSRITILHSLVADYAEQLSGFDSGLNTQMQSFQEQIAQIHGDLKVGLEQLESVNNNVESAAVAELTERYEELVIELDTTLNTHASLTAIQTQLGNELQSLVQCVEMLRDQKCDRDEVIDGLRDKADSARLSGLLTQAEFDAVRADLELRLSACHDKFDKQDSVWMKALKDLDDTADSKAHMMDLLAMRDDFQDRLLEIDDRLRVMAIALGEPEAALLTRKLALNAECGACRVPAHMGARPPDAGAPPRLPALRPPTPPQSETEVCARDWTDPGDRHICRRWCGGSHTLVTEATTRGRPPPAVVPTTKQYAGYGLDGRIYMMADELQPCVECNAIEEAAPNSTQDLGAGDRIQFS